MDTTIIKADSVELLIQKLKKDLAAFPEGMNTLEAELESSSKHLPTYIKIVKTHVEQLSAVLNLDAHNNRTLETAGLAEPVLQLIKLFRSLEPHDLEMLDELAIAAKNWQPEASAAASSAVLPPVANRTL